MKEDIFRYLMAGGFAIFLVAQLFFSWVREGGFSLLPKLFLFLVNLAGCYISYLLIRQEKHQSNALSEKFCKAGKYIDCNKVTSSNYSNFYGLFTWAELGFAFFSSLALWVAIVPLCNGWLSAMWWFSLIILFPAFHIINFRDDCLDLIVYRLFYYRL